MKIKVNIDFNGVFEDYDMSLGHSDSPLLDESKRFLHTIINWDCEQLPPVNSCITGDVLIKYCLDNLTDEIKDAIQTPLYWDVYIMNFKLFEGKIIPELILTCDDI